MARAVNNITQLRTVAGGVENVFIVVLGGASKDDGNGFIAYWNPSSTATDDGIDVFEVEGVLEGRWIKQKTPVVTSENPGGGTSGPSDITDASEFRII